MSKKKIIFVTIVLMISFSGCISEDQVGIKLSQVSPSLNNSSFNVSYISKFPEPQNVTINIKTSDFRLGLSTTESGIYKQSFTLDQEVGPDYINSKRIYVKPVGAPIPPGTYKITATIEGEKSKNLLTFPAQYEIMVGVSP